MNYKVSISGASGRMGKELTTLLTSPYRVQGVTFELNTLSPDVWIDFSHPDATVKLLETIQLPVVIGTTGFNDAHLSKIHTYATKYPVLLAPNMSFGVNVMKRVLQSLGELKSMGFEVALSETHHKHKKDAPSGTAKSLIDTLTMVGFNDIQISVTRAGAEKGLHNVTFYSEEEELSIEHRVVDRKVFSKGALLGAAFLLNQKLPGLYSYDQVVSKGAFGKAP